MSASWAATRRRLTTEALVLRVRTETPSRESSSTVASALAVPVEDATRVAGRDGELGARQLVPARRRGSPRGRARQQGRRSSARRPREGSTRRARHSRRAAAVRRQTSVKPASAPVRVARLDAHRSDMARRTSQPGRRTAPGAGMSRRCAVVGGGIVGAAVARPAAERRRPDGSRSWRRRTRSPGTRPGATAASSTPASTTRPARSRPGCAGAASACCRSSAPSTTSRTTSAARSWSPSTTTERAGSTASRSGPAPTACPASAGSTPRQLRELEPHVRGVAGLHSPTTAIVDFPAVTRALARPVVEARRQVRLGTEVIGLSRSARRRVVLTGAAPSGERERDASTRSSSAPGCRPTGSPRLAGDAADPRIVPFRGEYYLLRPGAPAPGATAWSTRCPTRATRSSACTSRRASTARCWSGPTPCSPWPARATAGATVSPSRPGRAIVG